MTSIRTKQNIKNISSFSHFFQSASSDNCDYGKDKKKKQPTPNKKKKKVQ